MSEQRVISYKIEVDDAPVKSLKQQLREATLEAQRLATAEIVDQAALAAAVQKTAELKDAMADVNEQVAVFASGSKYEQASNALGQVKQAIFALDFEKAQERAMAFANVAKTINFGDAIKSAIQMGRTFMILGKALLTNPIFLLAAVIAGVVYIVYKLLDALGIIKIVMDALKAVIQPVVDLFFSLTDAIGLTSKAAEEEAEKIKTSYAEMTEAMKENFTVLENSIENELKILKAKSTGTKEELEAIRKKEVELLWTRQKNAQDNLKLAEKTLYDMQQNSEITKEEIEEQRKKVVDLQMAYDNARTASLEFFANEIRDMKLKAQQDADKQKEDEDKRKKENEANAKEAAERRKQAAAERKQREAEQKAEQERILKESAKFQQSLQRQRQDNETALIQDEIDRVEKQKLIALQRQAEDIDFTKMTADAKLAWDMWYLDEKARIEKEAAEARIAYQKEQQDISNAENETTRQLEFAKIKEQTDKATQMQIDAEQKLKDAKEQALLGGLALMSSIFSGNEKIQKALFLVEKGKAAADVVVNGLKAQGVLAAQLAVGTGLLGNPITAAAGVAQVAAAKSGMIANKIGMGTALAGILAASIDKFKSGGGTPPVSGGGGGGGGGGGVSASMGQPQQTPQINMFQNNQNNQPMSGVNRVAVVDYTDIQNTGNRVAMLQNAVSLG